MINMEKKKNEMENCLNKPNCRKIWHKIEQKLYCTCMNLPFKISLTTEEIDKITENIIKEYGPLLQKLADYDK